MKTEKIPLTLYVISSLLAIIAIKEGFDIVKLFANPVVVPSIFFYYLAINVSKVNFWFFAVFALFFIGGTINVLEIENSTIYIMIPYFLSYLILLKMVVEDVKKISYNKIGLVFSLFVFVCLMFLMYNLVKLFSDGNSNLVVPVIIYSVFLAAFGAFAVYYYYVEKSPVAYYLLIVALLSIFSDVFYAMFNLIFHLPELRYIEFSAQLISYFFMAKYVTLKDNKEECFEYE